MQTACVPMLLQARSAELLQLHTELRRTMFGTSSLARMTRLVGIHNLSAAELCGHARPLDCIRNNQLPSCSHLQQSQAP